MKFDKSVWQTLALISQLGFSIIIPVLLCTWGGMFLERKFSISVTVPCIVVGILAGVRNAYMLLKTANSKPEVSDEKEG